MLIARKLLFSIAVLLGFGISSIAQNLTAFCAGNNKWGYKDDAGNIVIQPQFEWADWFSENGLAPVILNSKWGFINRTGKFVIKPKFDFAREFAKDGLAAVESNGKWGYINKTGLYVIQPKFDAVDGFSSNGLSAVNLNGKWGFINKTGKFVIQLQFDDIHGFSDSGFARVQLNGKWGFIDKTGKFVVQPKFEYAWDFGKNGLAAVRSNGKWGYINKTGSYVIQPKFDAVDGFADNELSHVELNGKWGYITETGEFYSSLDQALTVIKAKNMAIIEEKKRVEDEKKYSVRVGESYTAYINRFVPTWEKYLQAKGIAQPVAPSTESVKQTVEKEVNAWQQKGEFETTSAWRTRVNDGTRAAKVEEITKRIENEYNAKVANYNARASQIRDAYEREYKLYSDRYCKAKANEFAQQSFELKPYDADNGTFLISSATSGDILLPVPLAKAQQFKANWSNIKTKVTAVFVPTGNDVALKSVTFGDYTYDGNTKANYAVTTVDYNFAPIEISNLDLASTDYNFGQISSAPAVTVSNSDAKTITATKVTPETKRIVAGNASDVDVNIPRGNATSKNTFAVVIANEHYRNAEAVENATNDGKVVAKYLNQTFGIPEKQVFTYNDATYGDIVGAITKLQNYASVYAGNDFNVLFYYAGHGVPDEYSREAYLMPVDGIPGNKAVNISLSSLYEKLGSLGASSVCVMLDACFSGAQRGDGMLALARGVAIKAKNAVPQGNMIVFSAAQGNETAYPYRAKGHGMFTYFLLKKLQETAGDVTLGELSDYVIDNVRKTSIVENNGKLQTPTVATSASAASTWRSRHLAR